VIDKPLYQNPLGGGSLDMGKYEGNPNFQGALEMSNAGMKIDPFGVAGLKEPKPQPELLGAFNPADQYTGGDPLVKGFLGSDFYNNKVTANVVPYTYQGKEMKGSGSYASDFKKYLESIGKGDLIQFPDQGIMSQEAGLGELKYGPDDSVIPDNNAMTPGILPGPITSSPGAGPLENMKLPESPPLMKTPGPIGGTPGSIFTGNATLPDNISDNFLGDGIFNSPSETTGQYLTGPNESANVLETLKNIEQGIASLGQGSMNQSSFGGFNNNFGIGSFFPPYGGMYG
jgi:hypothetical protein